MGCNASSSIPPPSNAENGKHNDAFPVRKSLCLDSVHSDIEILGLQHPPTPHPGGVSAEERSLKIDWATERFKESLKESNINEIKDIITDDVCPHSDEIIQTELNDASEVDDKIVEVDIKNTADNIIETQEVHVEVE